jgi:hypothetical protein
MVPETSIVDFLNELLVNEDLSARYQREPRAAMIDFGLTSDQALVVLGGSLSELRDAIQAEGGSGGMIIMGRMGVPPPP